MGKQKPQKGRGEALEKAKNLPDEIRFVDVWNMYNLSTTTCGKHNYPNPKATNCRDNPYCLKRLGLEKFEKLIKSCETDQKKIQSTIEPRDLEKQPSGLENSGNFCYVNSFLQIWFNDPVFRQIIYDWRPSIEFVSANPKVDIQEVMNHLQKLFYYLANSPFESCDVKDFVNILRLDNQQQDSHEFQLLFFNMLDRNLRAHPNGEATRRHMMARLQGSITQEIKCTCGKGSRKVDESLSLDLSVINAKTLSECIKNYFAAENLDDYQCDNCGERGNVQKSLEFTRLPEVLLLQLKRHVFDENGRYKKAKTAIQYPRKMNGSILNKNFSNINYDLCAVLIHEGDETKCGHYYDIIMRHEDEKWYQYNDTLVKESKAPGVVQENKQQASGKSTPDQRTWYGLVYRQRALDPRQIRPPPDHITRPWKNSIDDLFEGKNGNQISATVAGIEEVRKRQDTLTVLMDDLELCPNKENEYTAHPEIVSFLPVSLVNDILVNEFERVQNKKKCLEAQAHGEVSDVQDPDIVAQTSAAAGKNLMKPRLRKRQASQIEERGKNFIEKEVIGKKLKEHEMVLCSHKKIHIDQVTNGDVKAVSAAAIDKLLNKYGFRLNYEIETKRKYTTLRGPDLCSDCVQDLRHEALSKDLLERDEKLAVKVLKDEKARCSTRVQPPEGYFYIARKALQQYKRLVAREEEYRRQQREITSKLVFSTNKTNGTKAVAKPKDVVPTNKRTRIGSLVEADEEMKDEGSTELSNGHFQTLQILNEDEEAKQEIREMMDDLINSFTEEPNKKEANGLSNGELKDEKSAHLESDEEDGRPNAELIASTEFNAELKCAHGNPNDYELRLAVSPEEWRQLKENFNLYFELPVDWPTCSMCDFDKELKTLGDNENTTRIQELSKNVSALLKTYESRKDVAVEDLGTKYPYLVCNRFLERLQKYSRTARSRRPPIVLCQECLLCVDHTKPFIRIDPEELKEMAYPIPVTKDEWEAICEVMSRGEITQPVPFLMLEGGIIENFCADCHEKTLHEYNEKQYMYDNGSIYIKLTDDAENVGNSQQKSQPTTRRNTQKNLLKVKMGSKETVHDLKVKLYKLTQHSPVDQLIYQSANTAPLESELTLESARILPNNQDNPLLLIVQVAGSNTLPADEIRTPERGFADTALAH